MRDIVLVVHNVRSSHNVGSLLRTADGLGVSTVYLTGYSPHPAVANDTRLPHLVAKTTKAIHKTALGAETSQTWRYTADIHAVITELKHDNYTVFAIEQSGNSQDLNSIAPPDKCALIVGREVEGIELDVLEQCDIVAEIPMYGSKESYNVAQAAAMALYQMRFGTANP